MEFFRKNNKKGGRKKKEPRGKNDILHYSILGVK